MKSTWTRAKETWRKKKEAIVTLEGLKEVFYYDSDGFLISKKTNRRSKQDSQRYRTKTYKGKYFLEHRLIFFFFTGYFPQVVDHINRNPKDNRVENLRASTYAENMLNKTPVKNKEINNPHSKYRGITKLISGKRKKVWTARIQVKTKRYFLGYFKTEIEAVKARNKKAEELFGEDAILSEIPKTGLEVYF